MPSNTTPSPKPATELPVTFRWQLTVLAICFGLQTTILPSSALGHDSFQKSVQIPAPANLEPDSQDDDSIDYETPSGTGQKITKQWLQQFRDAGWKVETVEEDLPDDGEYELRKGKVVLTLSFDDPGFGPADISISSDSGHRLIIGISDEDSKPDMEATNSQGKLKQRAVQTAESGQTTSKIGDSRIVTETVIGNVEGLTLYPEEGQSPSYWVSPDGRTLAWFDGSQNLLRVNLTEYSLPGQLKPDSFVFSPDSRRHAYVVTGDEGEIVVVDGEQIHEVSRVLSPVVFSVRGTQFAFVAETSESNSSRSICLNGTMVGDYENVTDEIAFTSDESELIFGFKDADQWKMASCPVSNTEKLSVLNHEPIDNGLQFIVGSQGQLAYSARFGSQSYGVMFEGKQVGPTVLDLKPGSVVMSEDGQQVSFVGDVSPVRNAVIHAGKAGPAFNIFEEGRIDETSLVLSPDGRRHAFIVQKDDEQYVVIDGKRQKSYSKIDLPEFSDNGKSCSYLALKDGSPVVVIDGAESPRYAMAGMPEFAKSGETKAWYAELDGQQFMVINNAPQERYDSVTRPAISDDGRYVAYSALSAESDTVKLHDTANGTTRDIGKHQLAGQTKFLPESHKLIYLALDEDATVVVDGEPGRSYTDVISPISQPSLRITGPGTIRYLATRNDLLLLVEEQITP